MDRNKNKYDSLNILAKSIIEWLENNANPHTMIIIDNSGVGACMNVYPLLH